MSEKNAKNLTGRRFGKLVAVGPTERREKHYVVWECLCDCGKTCFVSSRGLIHGFVKSCGCLKTERGKELGKCNAKDLTGQRFGKLVAIRPTERREKRFVVWECLCDCGKTYFAHSANLIGGHVKSCGCLKTEIFEERWKRMAKDLTGQRFGKLVAVGPTERREKRYIVWECLCDCGNTYFTTSGNLAQGHVKSCGCLSKGRKYGDNEPKDQQGESSL